MDANQIEPRVQNVAQPAQRGAPNVATLPDDVDAVSASGSVNLQRACAHAGIQMNAERDAI